MLSDCFCPVSVVKVDAVATSSSMPLCKSAVNVVQGNGVIGSAYLEMGNTKVLCSVVGPTLGNSSSLMTCDLEGGVFQCEVHYASNLVDVDIAGMTRQNLASIEKRLSEAMTNALESSILLHLYPKALISIHAVILQSSVNDLSSLINCGSLCLMNASIELKDIVSAYSVSCNLPDGARDLSGADFETVFTSHLAKSKTATKFTAVSLISARWPVWM